MAAIAFVGLGNMGLPMAKRLLAGGHDLRVATHRNGGPVRELRELGATVRDSLPEAVEGADIVVTVLPGDRQIEEALLAPSFFEAVGDGAVIIEMSTASSGCVRKIAARYREKNVRLFDAPVSGGIKGAEEGTLTIIGGGDAEVLREIRPVLELMGERIFHVGGIGAGKSMKAVNQMIVASNVVAVAEALHLARHLDLDPELVYEVVSSSSGASTMFRSKFLKMAREDFSSAFRLSLMKKDIALALEEGKDIALPLAHLASQCYLMLGAEQDGMDFSVVSTVFRKRSA